MIRCPVCAAPLCSGASVAESNLVKIRDGEVVIYMRGNVWQARYRLPDQSWHRISTKRRNLDDAMRVAAESYDFARFRAKEGMVAVSRRFRDVANQTIKQLELAIAGGNGKVSYRDYIQAINKYLNPFFGNLHIDKLDQSDLAKFDAWRVEKMGKEPAASTVNNHVSAINRVFGTALAEGWIQKKNIPSIKIKGKNANDDRHSLKTNGYVFQQTSGIG
jgi:integrase